MEIPKLKKSLKSFLTEEDANISKADVVKISLGAATLASLSGVSLAQCGGYDNVHSQHVISARYDPSTFTVTANHSHAMIQVAQPACPPDDGGW